MGDTLRLNVAKCNKNQKYGSSQLEGKQRIPLSSRVAMGISWSPMCVINGCESWTIKKAECRRIDAFEPWCWRRLLTVPWTGRRSNQSILKEISPEYSLEGLMLKLKLQYFGHLMGRTAAAATAAKSLQSCPTLSDPKDCSLPGSSIHGIFQARVLEWGAIAFSKWEELTHLKSES